MANTPHKGRTKDDYNPAVAASVRIGRNSGRAHIFGVLKAGPFAHGAIPTGGALDLGSVPSVPKASRKIYTEAGYVVDFSIDTVRVRGFIDEG